MRQFIVTLNVGSTVLESISKNSPNCSYSLDFSHKYRNSHVVLVSLLTVVSVLQSAEVENLKSKCIKCFLLSRKRSAGGNVVLIQSTTEKLTMQQALERGQEGVTHHEAHKTIKKTESDESTQLNTKTATYSGQSKSNLNTTSKKTKPIGSLGSYMKIEGVELRDTEKSLSDLALHQTALHKAGATHADTDVSVASHQTYTPSTPVSRRCQKTQKYSYHVQRVKNSLNRDRSSSLPLISGVGTPGSPRKRVAAQKVPAGGEGKGAPLSPTLGSNITRTRKVTMSPKKSPKKSSPEKSRLPVKHQPDIALHPAVTSQNNKEEKQLSKGYKTEPTSSPTEKTTKLSQWSEVHTTKSSLPEMPELGIEVKSKQQSSRIPVPKNWNALNATPQAKNQASRGTTNAAESKETLKCRGPPSSCSSSNLTLDSVGGGIGDHQSSKVDNYQYREYMPDDELDSGSQEGEDPLCEVSFNNNTSEEGPSQKLLCGMIHTDSSGLWST